MNVNTGQVYPNIGEALRQGERVEDLVEIKGTPEQVDKLSRDIVRSNAQVKKARRARNKAARRSRKRNRG